jgi:hypothetical protein
MTRLRLRPLEKKYLACLKCGQTIWTDAARRICRECTRKNSNAAPRMMHRVCRLSSKA